jgi:hypothetical protein
MRVVLRPKSWYILATLGESKVSSISEESGKKPLAN